MDPMDYTIAAFLIYLAVSLALTVWVARTLSRNGRLFLIDAFGGDTALADAVNRLLVVGFYLINGGYATLALKFGDKARDLQGVFEFCSEKVGLVLLVLGVMHFLNLYVFARLKRRRDEEVVLSEESV
jgi:hypothetical protein